MNREEFKWSTAEIWSVGYSDEHRRIMNICFEYINSLEQQNTALQSHIKDLEELKTCEGCNAEFNNDCNLGILPKNIYSFEFSCSKYKPKRN